VCSTEENSRVETESNIYKGPRPLKQTNVGSKPEINVGDMYEQGGLPQETKSRGMPLFTLYFLFLLFIFVLIAISFCFLQAIKLTSEEMV